MNLAHTLAALQATSSGVPATLVVATFAVHMALCLWIIALRQGRYTRR